MAAFTELLIEQGASFSTTVNVSDSAGAAINLYGYTASSQMRKSFYATSNTTISAVISLACIISSLFLLLISEKSSPPGKYS